MDQTKEQYRTDQCDSVYELNDDETAYTYIGKLNGRTLAQFLHDRNEAALYAEE